MKMNKLMIATLIVAVALAGTANAAGALFPIPLSVILSQKVVTEVVVTNTYTGEVMVQHTGADGGTTFDMANFERGVVNGAKIRVEVLGTSTEFTHTNQPYYDIYIDVGAQVADKCVVTESLDYGEVYQIENDRCQVYVYAQPYKAVKCNVNTEGLKPGEKLEVKNEECDVTVTSQPEDYTLAGVLVVLLGLLGTGAYIRASKPGSASVGYKLKDGKVQHSHKNVSGYHSPDTAHKNQPHKKGEMYPRYSTKKNASGEYEYLG